MSINQENEKNHSWKGDNAGKKAIHLWVKRRKSMINTCENCNQEKRLDLANISQQYKRDVNDFKWLCRKCHMKFDNIIERTIEKYYFKRGIHQSIKTEFKKGHTPLPINRRFSRLFSISLFLIFILFILNAEASKDQEDSRSIGYVDDGKVIHLWNEIDDYYINSTAGFQITNHKNDYWTHNYFCAGAKSIFGNWNFICNDNIGFAGSIKTDNATYINVTWQKSINNVVGKLTYHLGNNDPNITLHANLHNGGIFTASDTAIIWNVKDIRIDGNKENDAIAVNNSQYLLNKSLDLFFENFKPSNYKMFDNKTGKYLVLAWQNNTNYNISIRSQTGQYNAPVALTINTGRLGINEDKSVFLYWIDAGEQFARPDADISQGLWTVTPLWSNIDEVIANDADFITSSNNPVADIYQARLSDVTDPVVSTGHIMRVRYKSSNSVSGHDVFFTFRLKQGTTVIAEQIGISAIDAAFTTSAFTLTAAQADSITDYTNLNFEFEADFFEEPGQPNEAVVISWAELEVPAVGVPITKGLLRIRQNGLLQIRQNGLLRMR